jgi:hypothetical protein
MKLNPAIYKLEDSIKSIIADGTKAKIDNKIEGIKEKIEKANKTIFAEKDNFINSIKEKYSDVAKRHNKLVKENKVLINTVKLYETLFDSDLSENQKYNIFSEMKQNLETENLDFEKTLLEKIEREGKILVKPKKKALNIQEGKAPVIDESSNGMDTIMRGVEEFMSIEY